MKLVNDEDDPDIYLTKLEALRVKMNAISIAGKSTKSEMDLLLHVIANIPESYIYKLLLWRRNSQSMRQR